jgi:hypothetical protein
VLLAIEGNKGAGESLGDGCVYRITAAQPVKGSEVRCLPGRRFFTSFRMTWEDSA